ncbi:MerR family transcriptional regulator [Rhodococcus sp. IEGM 1307]|uniref:MerR family transcriptional regulator n=1 Tax=Rhodococcus sp. IEGM 1307 TaxID=3047091 RepID=UPI0024B7AE13|nr:MerR family transcriptional regulator [Rhodococcus sp. IEGM 1307]MDI9975843.1 MerR family transcriptional regulator [Rhodococcus sp. IEGM 1307]
MCVHHRVHPSAVCRIGQALRFYEQHGLINPARTSGGTRRYSDDDLLRLRRIAELIADGVNLTGIARVLDLEHLNMELASDNARLVEANSRLESDNARLRTDETRGGPT